MIEYAESLNLIGECMRDSRDFELAGGFFALAGERLEPTVVDRLKPVSENDARAAGIKERASAELKKAVDRLGPETRSKARDVLEQELKAQVRNKVANMAELRDKRSHIDPVLAWKELKESLLKSAPVLTGP